MKSTLPKAMKAAQCSAYGDVFENIVSVADNVPVPRLDDPYEPTEDIHPIVKFATRQDRKTHMILKTLAVALAPGDCRVMSGKTRFVQGPPSFPYVPGGDVCGIVVETMQDESYFQKGDIVTARFTVAPRDGIAEYSRVSSSVCDKVPDGVSPEAAAALASASAAVCFADYIHDNDRVLILGAGGGVGSHVCQLASGKASYVCGVSCDAERLLKPPLSCDDAIDYTKEDVLESIKYQHEPFDTIIDMSASGLWLQMLANSRSKNPLKSIVKPSSQGGRYITSTPDAPKFEAKSFWPILKLFLFQPVWRSLWYSKFNPFTRNKMPAYVAAKGLPDTRDIITRTMKLAQDGKLQGVVEGPYPMTTIGVHEAFQSLQSRHCKGKAVVKVAEPY